MKYIKDIVYIVIIILIIVIARDWLKDKIITSLGGYTHKEVVTKIDSTYQKGLVDTTALFNHYVQTKGIVLNPDPEIITKYKYLNPVTKEEEVVDNVKKFTVNVTDSLIDGNFTVFNNNKGDLLEGILDYKPKFPKYITRVDTIKVHTNTTETLTNKRSLLGIGVGYNNLQYPSILGSYTTKNKWQFIYEYGKPLNETINIIEGTTFKTKKTDLHSFKIIKNF